MEIPNRIINDILNYLSQQPYREVASIIGSVISLQAQQQQQQEELPLDDTD
tara:strand:- start:523 stop:675 length:153 start_codon:yes stop_codon:yes gene_type:complete